MRQYKIGLENVLKTSDPKLRCSRFVRSVREVVLSVTKECMLHISKKSCAMGQKRKRNTDKLGINTEQEWQVKQRKEKVCTSRDRKKLFFKKI